MATRTVIINGDPTWRFRALMWSQALDLFPITSGVIFRDCVPETQMHADHRIVLGNFPDDFSSDPFALNDEMREDVRRLVRDRTEYLNVAVVLCEADLACLAAARPGAVQDSLSIPAAAAIRALRVLMEAIARQTESDHDRAPAVTRLWLSLVVRNGGQSHGDRQRADDAVRQFRDARSFINNVFFLSNGRDLDKGMGASEHHFAKLRILIDLLRHEEGQGRLRRRSRDHAGIPLALRLSAERNQLAQPTLSAELRLALVTQSERLLGELGASADADLVDQFRSFEQNLTALLPGLAGDNFTRATAASALDRDVDISRQTERERADRTDATQDARDIAAILYDLRPARQGLLPQWHSDRRRDRWRKLEVEYEGAVASSSQTYETVIEQRMRLDRKTGAENQNALKALLRDVRIPTGVAGDRAVASLRERLQTLETETIREIQSAQDSRVALAANIAAEEPGRARAFDVLDRAEAQLLRLGTLRPIILTSAIFLFPIVVHFGARWVDGRSSINSFEAIFEALGPVGFFGIGTLALSILAALILGVILSRQRLRVLRDVQGRLEQNYQWLKEQYAARLSVAHNRMRLGGLQQAQMTIRASEATDVFDAVSELVKRMRQGDDVPRRAMADRPALVRDAVEAFGAKRGWQERFAAFLAHEPQSASSELTVSLPGWPDPKIFHTTASLAPIALDLREPGDVR